MHLRKYQLQILYWRLEINSSLFITKKTLPQLPYILDVIYKIKCLTVQISAFDWRFSEYLLSDLFMLVV